MKTILKLSMIFSLLILFFNACKKDRDETPTPSTPTSIVVPVSGTVVDAYGQPLADVTVKAGNYTTTTDYTGSFYFPTVNFGTSRYIITFEKTGYFTLTRSGVPQAGKPINLAIGLIDENNPTYAAQKTFNATQADSIELPDGSVVSFPANAFMNQNGTPYTGMVTVKACYLDPTWDNYGMYVFGGDLYAKDINNNEVMLNPFSGLNVVLYDNAGNKIQLDTINHKMATVAMKIPAPLVTEAPNNIETWEYATAQGQQVQRGQAGKHGDKYVGQVAHFSYWSCQRPHTGKATIWGKVIKVVNGDSVGISGVKVKVGRQIVLTDSEGKYEAKVPDNLPGIVVVPIFGNIGFSPTILNNALANNESKRIDFVLPMSSIIAIHGVVKNSNGQPIANAYVSAEWYSGSQQKVVTFTNNLGRFILPVDANAYYVTLVAKTPTQEVNKYIYYPTDTTEYILIMPATPGNNKLTVNGTTVFSIVGNSQGNDVSGYFGGDSLEVYVHVFNTGMFSIYSHNVQFPINVGQQYSIPNDFTVQYGTQQLVNPDSLQSGTITFTKFSTNPGQLIEGTVTGQGWQGNQVTINFSVPISVQKSMINRKQKK
ncbi:MAG: carboxypeptidase regulatory-like domain-containing protein [Bacteroidales bacterium]|nr:carboxypeptidase regulatory-like domain-containing protein [Bacteroidales bacterium]